MVAEHSEATAHSPMLPGTGRNESLHRAFDLLEVLSAHPSGASVAEICKACDLPRTTVSRLLASLFDVGAVARIPTGRKWVLGPTIMRLTDSVNPLALLQERGRQVLHELTDTIGETTMLAVPTGPATARIIDEVEGPKILGVRSSWAGQTISSAASGFVRQLLAELPLDKLDRILEHIELVNHTPKTKADRAELRQTLEDIRRHQYVVVVDELEEGLSGIGVPVRQDGKLIALLATYLPTMRLTPTLQDHALMSLQEGARKLTG